MKIDDLDKYFAELPDKVLDGAAHIIAETATEYYKGAFTRKEFGGKPWTPNKHPKQKGSLMVDSGNLMNSIHPAVVSPQKVVISAGNDKVPYARIQNEGGTTHPTVTPKMRAWARAMAGKKGPDSELYKGISRTKKQKLTVNIPARPFMGKPEALLKLIRERLDKFINKKLNP